jgi:hypothetical protein
MATWDEIGSEIESVGASGGPHDIVRRKYLSALSDYTGRNVLSYYSGWLQKLSFAARSPDLFSIDDNDKNGFMATIHGLDRTCGLDLILHTPGGGVAATESLVHYLHSMFGHDIRVIVPQIAMSAGTMIACAAKEIVMGKHSNLGPIDPQFGGIAAHGVIEEFERAAEEIRRDPSRREVWLPIISRYHPTFIGECEKAIAWSNEMVTEWLSDGMFAGLSNPDPIDRARRVIAEFGDHALTKSHDRHISMERAQAAGLIIGPLEDDQAFQDAVLSVHHATIQTLAGTPATKIIENHHGRSFVQNLTLN